MEIFFPEGTQPSWKITEIWDGGADDKHPHGNSRRWGSKAKLPSMVGAGGEYFLELHIL